MSARSSIASGLTAAVAAALSVLGPAAAHADDPVPSCEQMGQTAQRNIYSYNCEEFVPGSPYLTWAGAPITSGQGTAELWGTCVGGSLPYTIRVSWTISGVTHNASTRLTCSGGGKV
ncbi:hypothetical protein GCM10009839_81840 [Catenulispora yoronensis]|uniref:Ig-like domain-containing protein n=1 Tax=Catenulispora yoronensis TaxID=450799 RepID=A0ABP5GZJ8_9ACTN